ncbi:hypothetical protein PIB30_052199 [Stylosanthes scabra]|uniref:Transposase MuDR plant domain-containing protein n=1 Tax=Stylosanthes scabra TaxID=79078 RepID=A0ABU6WJ62_9FABA|nr:hypothetical protein [Stylosanthes scabra]
MFSIYFQTQLQASLVELYMEFEQLHDVVGELEEPNLETKFEDYYSDSECNYEIVDAAEEDGVNHTIESDVEDVARPPVVTDGEFSVGMKFNSREDVIKVVKEYTIQRGVDYSVFESELTTFYAKCVQYGPNCA